MINDQDKPPSADLEREIREGRKFSMQEAMARVAGPGAMKGASPVSPVQQAENEIGNWLRSHVPDTAGALKAVLLRQIKSSALLMENVDRPLMAVEGYCERILASDDLLRELVRQADAEWGRMMDERPYFEREGAGPHPDDPYTVASVREVLVAVSKHFPPP